MDFYQNISPISEKSEVIKRVPLHPYFTSQPFSLIQKYIQNFCHPGGVVLDLFGGSGTTLREALLLGHKGIHVDLLPWSCFIAKVSAYSPQDIESMEKAFQNLASGCQNKIQALYKLKKSAADKLSSPPGFPDKVGLPKNSDVQCLGDLFTQRNKAALWYLLTAIRAEKNEKLKNFFLFVFSGILARASKTYWKDKKGKGGGDSGIYKVYRYWIPPKPDERNVWDLFESRVHRVAKLIRDDNKSLNAHDAKIICGSATDVSFKIGRDSVDYVFTDPPYAKHITYLDLSTMYHALLGMSVSQDAKAKEAIEGGDNAKTQDEYIDLIKGSFATAHRVLKPNRWMTVVFTHKDPQVFTRLIQAATEVGFELVNAVSQDTKRPSFHKINNSATVIKGQMMLNFYKTENKKPLLLKTTSLDVRKIIIKAALVAIESNNGKASYSEIVHDVYKNLLAKNSLQAAAVALRNLEKILDEEFQRELVKNELSYRLKDRKALAAA
jgi:DNA modification methylase